MSKKSMLDRHERLEYFKRYKYEQDLVAREIIILDGVKLVYEIITKEFTNPNFEGEEFLSVALLALVRSVDDFINQKGKRRSRDFIMFASNRIRNALLQYIREEKKNFYKSSLDEILEHKEILDISQNVEILYENNEEREIIKQELSSNHIIDRQIVKLYFGFESKEPLTTLQIADELELSEYYVIMAIEQFLNDLEPKITMQYKRKSLK